ncbi:phosphoribosylglycinamide formyltransferase [Actinomycetospora sp. NBRC 106375]|uniref:MmcQ/YjbR family DNA-binding protein n=1 Tax=Actinomycetospora sp. NBRC 106375 TaxID=3032207 RepID=UPI0024A1F26C|nr:MmcQ/YjbR family DNA-binding protein [Actinomycetospora sp. NBRC 106375]GLZ49835.1 phosphoribosylglycinamide formyltransferase [Actinomycetospora sp. NBRC 106375]
MDRTALLDGVRSVCTALPEVTEGPTHGAPTWFVRRRSFAKFVDPEDHHLDEPHVALWAAAPSGARRELVAADPEQYFPPPFGGRDWVALRLDLRPEGPDWEEVREVLTDAYRQVAPRTLVARLDGLAGKGP